MCDQLEMRQYSLIKIDMLDQQTINKIPRSWTLSQLKHFVAYHNNYIQGVRNKISVVKNESFKI